MGVFAQHTTPQGASIRVEYRDNNLKLTEFFWSIPAGLVGFLTVWDADGSFELSVSGDGSRKIPGSLSKTLVEKDDGLGTVPALPEGTFYRFEVRTD